MTIITPEQALQIFIDTREWSGWMIGTIVDAIGKNITSFAKGTQTAWTERDWMSLSIYLVLIAASIYIAYRIIRKKILEVLEHFFTRH